MRSIPSNDDVRQSIDADPPIHTTIEHDGQTYPVERRGDGWLLYAHADAARPVHRFGSERALRRYLTCAGDMLDDETPCPAVSYEPPAPGETCDRCDEAAAQYYRPGKPGKFCWECVIKVEFDLDPEPEGPDTGDADPVALLPATVPVRPMTRRELRKCFAPLLHTPPATRIPSGSTIILYDRVEKTRWRGQEKQQVAREVLADLWTKFKHYGDHMRLKDPVRLSYGFVVELDGDPDHWRPGLDDRPLMLYHASLPEVKVPVANATGLRGVGTWRIKEQLDSPATRRVLREIIDTTGVLPATVPPLQEEIPF